MENIEPMSAGLEINFAGPYAWFQDADVPALDQAPMARSHGIYLWTVPTEAGEWVYYVGETGRGFAARMTEHLRQQLSGMYHIYDPKALAHGDKRALWNGLYGDTRETEGLHGFVNRLPELSVPLAGFIKLMRFHVAELSQEKRLRERIEAAISRHLKNQPGIIGTFQDDGIRYRPRRTGEEPVIVKCRSAGRILGLPDRLEA